MAIQKTSLLTVGFGILSVLCGQGLVGCGGESAAKTGPGGVEITAESTETEEKFLSTFAAVLCGPPRSQCPSHRHCGPRHRKSARRTGNRHTHRWGSRWAGGRSK